MNNGGGVKSVLRVIAILDYYAQVRRPATLTMLSKVLDLPKSSCLAIVKTLESRGFLYEVAPRSGYYPTRKWLQHARSISDADPIATRLQPILQDLQERTGETVILARRAGSSVLYVNVIESQAQVRYAAQIGQLRPLHATASGKAILSQLTKSMRDHILGSDDLTAMTDATITDRQNLEAELQDGSARGWHVTAGETESDVTGIAMITSVMGEPYAVVVAGPEHRISSRLVEFGAALTVACARASACAL